MRITLVNQKGGVGKSTVAILLGSALQSAGFSVAFDDRDEQGSLSYWAKYVGKLPLIGEIESPDVIICDTPGRLDLSNQDQIDSLKELLGESDRIILVCEKSEFSLRASTPMAEMIQAYKGEQSQAYILFNKVRSATKTGRRDNTILVDRIGVNLPVLSNTLPLAAPYESIQSEAYSAVSGKYKGTILKLALEILK